MNIPYLLRRAAQQHGDRTAVLTENHSLTYSEFRVRVLRTAEALRRLGLRKGSRIGVLLLNSPQYLELYCATAEVGIWIVPMNIRLSPDEMAFWLNDSASTALVVDDKFCQVPSQLASTLQTVQTVLYAGGRECPPGMLDYSRLVEEAGPVEEADGPDEEDLAGLFYTSGTTGGAKGVMLTHKNLYSNAMHAALGIGVTKEWVWTHAAPMFHLANGALMYALLMAGAAHSFLPAFEPELFLKTVERFRVSSTILVPTMINMLLNHPAIDRYDVSSLRQFLYGASPMPLGLLRRAVDKMGNIFTQGYGLSEAAPLLTLLEPTDHKFDQLDQEFTPVKSAGRPVVGVEVRVVDEMDRDLPPRQGGEIIARGPNIMKGYWNQPGISAHTLRGGWLHTGDIGAFDEHGFLYILDRAKDMVKTGGENVHSPEVESVVSMHPGVLEAAIIGVPDEKWSEAIKAVVVRKPDASFTGDELIGFCRQRLTHFKCPSTVDFIDALPKGGTGKILKSKLRQPYWQGKAKGVN
ncbi:MAG: long-chain-fatty-acid--CoA ligase [Acidobacteriia bacterium]|nr:long-chain-fatty-acid--CoA ligase [Terriglobia bacterium]